MNEVSSAMNSVNVVVNVNSNEATTTSDVVVIVIDASRASSSPVPYVVNVVVQIHADQGLTVRVMEVLDRISQEATLRYDASVEKGCRSNDLCTH